jgi:hypothetical protein
MTVGTAFILGYFVGAFCFFISWCIAKKVIKKSEGENEQKEKGGNIRFL